MIPPATVEKWVGRLNVRSKFMEGEGIPEEAAMYKLAALAIEAMRAMDMSEEAMEKAFDAYSNALREAP